MLLRSAPYEAYFFDDDRVNIQEVQQACPGINAVLVDSACIPQAALNPENPWTVLVNRWTATGIIREERVSPGFNAVDELLAGFQEQSHKIVFFDWDQTLSQFEGLHRVDPRDYGATFRDMAEHYTGGPERFNRLRSMFAQLQTRGVQVYVLTNNPMCGGRCHIPPLTPLTRILDLSRSAVSGLPGKSLKDAELFLGIVRELLPDIPSEQVVHTGSHSRYKRNKGHWIRAHFQGLSGS